MTYTKLPITKIQISEANPRKAFDEDSILGLAQSIKTDGLLQNLIVGKAKGKKKLHPIICGERRFRAISHLVENGDLPKDYEVGLNQYRRAEYALTATRFLRNVAV